MKWDLKIQVSKLASLNQYGLDLFKINNYLEKISTEVGIPPNEFDLSWNSICNLQHEMFDTYTERGEKNKSIQIFEKVKSELLLYLVLFDENQLFKIKKVTSRAFIDINGSYCPILLDINGNIILNNLLFIYYNLKNVEYCQMSYSYTPPKKWTKYEELKKEYMFYENIKIIPAPPVSPHL